MIHTSRLDLDPSHPGLDHHRAGGLPLFGTSMGLAAMAQAAHHLLGPTLAIETIAVFKPRILDGEGPHHLTLKFETAEPAETLRATLASDPETIHFQATVLSASSAHATRHPMPPPHGITPADIYRLFFHGPAFQVIAAAQIRGPALVSRFASLDPLLAPPVRLIEFALQSAGLLELATSGRHRIPHRIGRIAPLAQALPEPAAPLFAHARYAGAAIDIDVADGFGRLILAITAYETLDLPFPANQQAATALTAKLRETATRVDETHHRNPTTIDAGTS